MTNPHLLDLLSEQYRREQTRLRTLIDQAKATKQITPETVEAYAALHLKDDHGNPIIAAPHHKLWLHFMCDTNIRKLMIIAPYGSAKTTWMISAYLGLHIGIHPLSANIIACNASETAASRSMALKSAVESPDYRTTFPELEIDFKRPYTQEKWSLKPRNSVIANRIHDTISAYGVGSPVIGSRADLIIADDLLDKKNTATATSRREMKLWLYSTLISRLKMQRGRIIVIGTSWHIDDFYSTAKQEGGWVVVHVPMLSDTPELYATITYPDGYTGKTLGTPVHRGA